MPLPGRHLTAMIMRYNGHSILVDCGEGTQVALRKYAWSMHSIDGICFTHVHGDHVAGISGLLSSMATEGRTEAVHIIGPKHIADVISALCVVVRVPFAVVFHEAPSESLTLHGVTISPFPVNHNIACYGYRFDVERRPKFDPVRAKALQLPVRFWSQLQAGETVDYRGKTFYPKQVLGEERKGISLVYSTDTRPCVTLENAAIDCDLLITEGIYADPDKAQSAVEKFHMTTQEACVLAKRAQARRVWLTHYSPSFRNQGEYEDLLEELNERVCFGKDGMKTTLEFES